jgi:hypothetical protein
MLPIECAKLIFYVIQMFHSIDGDYRIGTWFVSSIVEHDIIFHSFSNHIIENFNWKLKLLFLRWIGWPIIH